MAVTVVMAMARTTAIAMTMTAVTQQQLAQRWLSLRTMAAIVLATSHPGAGMVLTRIPGRTWLLQWQQQRADENTGADLMPVGG